MTTSDLITGIYSPNDVARYTSQIVGKRRDEKALRVDVGVPAIDYYVKPVLPGDNIFVMAYTSHGKTSFMQFWARQVAKQLQRNVEAGAHMDRVVVYITWETLIEEFGLYDLCGLTGISGTDAWYGDIDEAQEQELKVAAMKRAAMPIWLMGHSLSRRRAMKAMTMPVVLKSLEQLEIVHHLRPAIIYIDYIQRIDHEDVRLNRRTQMIQNADWLQQLGRECGCPVVIACQAGRQVQQREFRLPQIADGQESSRIEQDADKVLALWYPCRDYEPGHHIPELDVDVTDDLMVFGVRKQRHYTGVATFPVRFDPQRNTFSSWEQKRELEQYEQLYD